MAALGRGKRRHRVNQSVETLFPNLTAAGYQITSAATPEYNCIAWAAAEDGVWWWPDSFGDYYWPATVPRIETLEAFAQAYRTLGYEPCESASLEFGFDKIAVYINTQGQPTHAARQLRGGAWTSKLGQLEDIEHAALEGLHGAIYGRVGLIMRRDAQTSAE